MAQPSRRHPGNAPGPWFVDDMCTDCDASRQCAPELFGEKDGKTVVLRQPSTEAEIVAATRAMLICPTNSIGVVGLEPRTEGLFPLELEAGVYLCGFNSSRSYGSNSFFAVRKAGNFLVDSPRFVPPLVKRFESLGGVQDILLTHRDDVADADRYAAHFGARVWIHEEDRHAAPYATSLVRGQEPATIREGLVALPVPGHTRGSMMFLLEDRYLFTGDSLYWSRENQRLSAFQRQCWYSWEKQAESLARLVDSVRFEWVLAGHGGRHHAPHEVLRASLSALVERMRKGESHADEGWRGIAW
ncbi:MBL fold metallo-hydrolase [Archangium violaceum]|uniref:MBL fold metallo-hydrolase n=1 Tax=Archangium violaceum TaxID=83451 RepID=UPI00195030C9|nr:MBL fold metallo-hydrolase [Archangium violaceum]QRN93991.1 MBL fold metallo-hydrolase [Archangium violaceum]